MGDILNLKRNLITLSTLYSKGYKYTSKGGVLKVSKGALIVMKGQRKFAQLFVLQGSTVIDDADVTTSSLSDDDVTRLWHIYLGHISENVMAELSRRRLLDKQYHTELGLCLSCIV